ncbi:hypothetical protein DFP72DRAFT_1062297 [Ephemerocybe angulata]|uniref:Uncharacterized protein n=1 Tax=Ephemerocybe angulata TaxID=980116 RepID=A0A8H6MCZ4_9AGAR|nr:hypothetical protein DFP72DRAFT_1062297 [Tulosesus angulatus]
MSDKATPLPKTPRPGSPKGLLILASIQTLLLIGILGALAGIAAKMNSVNKPMNVQLAQPTGNRFVTVALPSSTTLNIRAATVLPVTVVSTVTISPAYGSTQTVTAGR